MAGVEQSASATFLGIPDLAWIADASPTALEDHLDAITGGTLWVALDEIDTIAGFILAEICGTDLHICELSVHVAHQRKGVGAKLIDAAADFARHKMLTCLTLTTFADVPWNTPYYKRLGFAVIDEADYDARMRDVFAREVRIGLPVKQRCAMRLALESVVDVS